MGRRRKNPLTGKLLNRDARATRYWKSHTLCRTTVVAQAPYAEIV